MNDTENIQILARALMASLRWSYLNTPEIVRGDDEMPAVMAESYVSDVHEMRAGLAVAKEVLK